RSNDWKRKTGLKLPVSDPTTTMPARILSIFLSLCFGVTTLWLFLTGNFRFSSVLDLAIPSALLIGIVYAIRLYRKRSSISPLVLIPVYLLLLYYSIISIAA